MGNSVKFNYLMLLVFIFFLNTQQVFAQTNFARHEFQASYGMGSFQKAKVALGNAFGLALISVLNHEEDDNYQEVGGGAIWNVGYIHQITPKFGLGLQYSMQSFEEKMWHREAMVEWNKYNIWAIMGQGRMRWSNKTNFYFYSSLYLGVGETKIDDMLNDTEDDLDSNIFGQLGLLGIHLGDEFGGFFEFGLGNRGILNVGLYGRF